MPPVIDSMLLRLLDSIRVLYTVYSNRQCMQDSHKLELTELKAQCSCFDMQHNDANNGSVNVPKMDSCSSVALNAHGCSSTCTLSTGQPDVWYC